jgi:hypothetical protein
MRKPQHRGARANLYFVHEIFEVTEQPAALGLDTPGATSALQMRRRERFIDVAFDADSPEN